MTQKLGWIIKHQCYVSYVKKKHPDFMGGHSLMLDGRHLNF